MEKFETSINESNQPTFNTLKINNHEEFDYLLILDFEAQCSNTENLKVQEIIEFPVVVYDLKQRAMTNIYFHQYTKPKEYPILTQFCTKLTGITQNLVDNGILLEDALINFDKFLNENKLEPSKFTFISCGDWDLQQCLRNEAKYKKIKLKDYFKKWINVKKVFYDYQGFKEPIGMTGMLDKLGLKLEGRHHSGIDDARNITKIVDSLINKGLIFDKKYLSTVK
jgi:inhibitor of KinA sporulation pathway (predicted exonuclease)